MKLYTVHPRPLVVLSAALVFVFAVGCGDDSTGGGGSGASSTNSSGPGAGGAGGSGGTGSSQGGAGTGGMTTGPGTGGSGGTGGDGGAPPVGCPSMVTNVPDGGCDLYLQNCPVATDTCEIFDSDPNTTAFEPITGCLTKNGLKSAGESCNATEDCQAHLTCVGSQCTPFCCPDDPNSCLGGVCNVNVDLINQDGSSTGFHFRGCSYSQTCELFNPTSCPAGDNCYNTDPGVTGCYTPTQPEGQELGDGVACQALNDCADSSVCIGDGTNNVCRFLCLANSGAQPGLGGCPAGQLCDTNSFDTGIPNVGFCHP